MNGAYEMTTYEWNGQTFLTLDDVLMVLTSFATLADQRGEHGLAAGLTSVADQIAAGAMS